MPRDFRDAQPSGAAVRQRSPDTPSGPTVTSRDGLEIPEASAGCEWLQLPTGLALSCGFGTGPSGVVQTEACWQKLTDYYDMMMKHKASTTSTAFYAYKADPGWSSDNQKRAVQAVLGKELASDTPKNCLTHGHREFQVLGSTKMPGTVADMTFSKALAVFTCVRIRSEAVPVSPWMYNAHEPCSFIGVSRPDSSLFVLCCLISACFSVSSFFVPHFTLSTDNLCCLRLLWFVYSLGCVL